MQHGEIYDNEMQLYFESAKEVNNKIGRCRYNLQRPFRFELYIGPYISRAVLHKTANVDGVTSLRCSNGYAHSIQRFRN